MTIFEALSFGKQQLASFPFTDTPDLDASVLLGHVLQMNRAKLLAEASAPISGEAFLEYSRVVELRAKGFPVAYLTGTKEFMGLDFCVEEGVLVPRPDTEILVEAVLDEIKKKRRSDSEQALSLIDVCTGSGCVAVSLALLGRRLGALTVAASDLSLKAVAVARKNATRLLPDFPLPVYESDLLESVGGQWDFVVSNPPYLTSDETQRRVGFESWKEPALALDGGLDGLDLVRRLIAQSASRLSREGFLFMEAAPHQMESIEAILLQQEFRGVRIWKDLAGFDRVIAAQSTR